MKCDQLKPACVLCERERINCAWPKTRLSQGLSKTQTGYMEGDVDASPLNDLVTLPPKYPRVSPGRHVLGQDSANLQHYINFTAETMTLLTPAAFHSVWTRVLLQQVQSCNFILGCIDSLTALHRAHLLPQSTPQYTRIAYTKNATAIAHFRCSVTGITQQNAHDILVFSFLQSILSLASPFAAPRPNPVSFLDSLCGLLRGLQGFWGIQPACYPLISDPDMRAWMESQVHEPDEPQNQALLQQIFWLSEIVAEEHIIPLEEREIYVATLLQLYTFFSTTPLQPRTWDVLCKPVHFSAAFIELVQQGKSPAVVIAMHWAVPSFHRSGHWLMKAWEDRMVQDIPMVVDQEWHFALNDLCAALSLDVRAYETDLRVNGPAEMIFVAEEPERFAGDTASQTTSETHSPTGSTTSKSLSPTTLTLQPASPRQNQAQTQPVREGGGRMLQMSWPSVDEFARKTPLESTESTTEVFVCTHCEEGFPASRNLDRHVRLRHLNARPSPESKGLFSTLKFNPMTSDVNNIRDAYDIEESRFGSHRACTQCRTKKASIMEMSLPMLR